MGQGGKSPAESLDRALSRGIEWEARTDKRPAWDIPAMERSAAHLRWLHWTLLTGFALALAGPSLSPADDDAAAPEKAAPEKTTPAEKPGDTKPSDAKPAPAAAEQAPADDQAPAEDESSNPDSSATPKPKLVPLRWPAAEQRRSGPIWIRCSRIGSIS